MLVLAVGHGTRPAVGRAAPAQAPAAAQVVHLVRPRERARHRLFDDGEIREGKRYLCGAPVARQEASADPMRLIRMRDT